MIAIIDYGMGNIHSVNKALQLQGAQTIVTNNPLDIKSCEKLILPGVGAFDDAMEELERKDLVSALRAHINDKKSFLGICLGMQLLFETSQEANRKRGLAILQGAVKKFEVQKGLKVPHMGWNQLKLKNVCPLLKGIADNSFVYFCHSYYPKPQDKNVIAATTDYDGEFTSIVWQENIYGVQFHPEKSQKVGLKMLDNFINLC